MAHCFKNVILKKKATSLKNDKSGANNNKKQNVFCYLRPQERSY